MAKAPAKAETVTEVATIDHASNSVAKVLPNFMQQYAGMGTENIDASDIETPRLKLMQGTSPEVLENDDAKVGQFWHTIANLSLGASIKVVPIYIEKMAILWNPRESGGGILARSTDLTKWVPPQGEAMVKINKGTKQVKWAWGESVIASKLLEWGSSDTSDQNSQPAATAMVNVVLGFPDYPDLPPAVFTFQRSTVRASKKFLGQLKLVKAPIFGCMFTMTSVDDSDKNNQPFKNVQLNPLGLIQDEDVFGEMMELHNKYKELGIKIKDIDGLGDEDAPSAGPSSGPVDPNAPKY